MGGDLINQTAPAKVIVFNFLYENMLLYLENETFTYEDGEYYSLEEIEFYRKLGFQIIYVQEGQTTLF